MDPAANDDLTAALSAAGYEVGAFVARGGQGDIYRAIETATGDDVIVKTARAGSAADLLESEADILAAIDHPAVPTLRFVYRESPQFFVTDWFPGVTLADTLAASGPLAPARALALFAQISDVLAAVHACDVSHGDLSPDNIIVGPRDTIGLIDFGVSRSTAAETMPGDELAGATLRYVAPEVLAGASTNHLSDQYSAAILLHEMLTGAWVYPDEGTNVATSIHHHLNSEPVPASEANHWLPERLDPPIVRALSREPADRFASMSDFATEIAGAAAGAATDAEAAEEMPVSKDSVSKDGVSPAGANGAKSKFGLAVGGALLLGAACLGWWAISQSDDDDQGDPVAVWATGDSALLACNLLTQPDFDDQVLPDGYFPSEADKNEIVNGVGVGRSPGLVVGTTGEYSLYGEMVEAAPNTSYVATATLVRQGEPGDMAMRIGWLDSDFGPLDPEPILAIDPADVVDPQRVTLRTDPSPAGTAYAVLILDNGESPGSIVADEMVLGVAGTACDPDGES